MVQSSRRVLFNNNHHTDREPLLSTVVGGDIKSLNCTCMFSRNKDKFINQREVTEDAIAHSSEWRRKRKLGNCDESSEEGDEIELSYCKQNYYQISSKLIEFAKQEVRSMGLYNNIADKCCQNEQKILMKSKKMKRIQENKVKNFISNGRQKRIIFERSRKPPSSIIKLIVNSISLVSVLLLLTAISTLNCQQVTNDAHDEKQIIAQLRPNASNGPSQLLVPESRFEMIPVRNPEYLSSEHDLLSQLLQTTGTVEEANQLLEAIIKAADKKQMFLDTEPHEPARDYSQVSASLDSLDQVPAASSQLPVKVFMAAPMTSENSNVQELLKATPDGQLKHRGLLDEIIEASAKGEKATTGGENFNVHYDDEQTNPGNINSDAYLNAQRALELIRASKQIENFMLPPKPQHTINRLSNSSNEAAELKSSPVAQASGLLRDGDEDGLSNNESISSLMIKAANPSRKVIANYSHWIIHEQHPNAQTKLFNSSRPKTPSTSLQEAIRFISAPISLTTTLPPNAFRGSQTELESKNNTKLEANYESILGYPMGKDEFLPVGSGHEPTRVRPASKFSDNPPIWSNKFDGEPSKWQGTSLMANKNDTNPLKIVLIGPMPQWITSGKDSLGSISDDSKYMADIQRSEKDRLRLTSNTSLVAKSEENFQQVTVTVRPTTVTLTSTPIATQAPVISSSTTQEVEQIHSSLSKISPSNQSTFVKVFDTKTANTLKRPSKTTDRLRRPSAKKLPSTNSPRKLGKVRHAKLKKGGGGGGNKKTIRSKGTSRIRLHKTTTDLQRATITTTTTTTQPIAFTEPLSSTVANTDTISETTAQMMTTDSFMPTTEDGFSSFDHQVTEAPRPISYSSTTKRPLLVKLKPTTTTTTTTILPTTEKPQTTTFSQLMITEPMSFTVAPPNPKYYTESASSIESPLKHTTNQSELIVGGSTIRPEVGKKPKKFAPKKQLTSTSTLSYLDASMGYATKRPAIRDNGGQSLVELNRLGRVQLKPVDRDGVKAMRRSTMIQSTIRLPEMEETTDYSNAQLSFPATSATLTVSEPVQTPDKQTSTSPVSGSGEEAGVEVAVAATTTERPAVTVAMASETTMTTASKQASPAMVESQEVKQPPEIGSSSGGRRKLDSGSNQSQANSVASATAERFMEPPRATLGQWVAKLSVDMMKGNNSRAHQTTTKVHPIDQIKNSFKENYNRSHAISEGLRIISPFGKRLVEQQQQPQPQQQHFQQEQVAPVTLPTSSHHLDIGQGQQVDTFKQTSPTPLMSSMDVGRRLESTETGKQVFGAHQWPIVANNNNNNNNNNTAHEISSTNRSISHHKLVANRSVQRRAHRPYNGWHPGRSIIPPSEHPPIFFKPYSTPAYELVFGHKERLELTTATPSPSPLSSAISIIDSFSVSPTEKPILSNKTKSTGSPEWSEMATIVSTSPYMLNVVDGTSVSQAPTTSGLEEYLHLSSPTPQQHLTHQFQKQLSSLFHYKLANRSKSSTTTSSTTTTTTKEPGIIANITSIPTSIIPRRYQFEYKAKDNATNTADVFNNNSTITQMVLRMFKIAADIKAKKDNINSNENSSQMNDERPQINFHAGSSADQPEFGSQREEKRELKSGSGEAAGKETNNANRRLRRPNKNKQQTMQGIQQVMSSGANTSGNNDQPTGEDGFKNANRSRIIIESTNAVPALNNEDVHGGGQLEGLAPTKVVSSSNDLATVLPAFKTLSMDTVRNQMEADLRLALNRNKPIADMGPNERSSIEVVKSDYNRPIDAYRTEFNQNLWPEDQQSGQQVNNSIVKENEQTFTSSLSSLVRPTSITRIQHESQTRATPHLNALSSKNPIGSSSSSLLLPLPLPSLPSSSPLPPPPLKPSDSFDFSTIRSANDSRYNSNEDQSATLQNNDLLKPLREQHEGETWIDGQTVSNYRWKPAVVVSNGEVSSSTVSSVTGKRKRRREPPVLPPLEQIEETKQINLDRGSDRPAQMKDLELVEPKGSMISLGNLFARLPSPGDYLTLKDNEWHQTLNNKPAKDQFERLNSESPPLQQQQQQQQQQQKRHRESEFNASPTITPVQNYISSTASDSYKSSEPTMSNTGNSLDMVAVNASQYQRTSLSPLMEDFRTKSILKTMISLGVPKVGSGAIQSIGGLAGKNEQVRLIRIDKSRRHNNSNSKQEQQTITPFTSNYTENQTDESLFTRSPVTETTPMATEVAPNYVSTPAPVSTTTCMTTTSPDAFSTRSTISRWHSLNEPQLRPLHPAVAKRRRYESSKMGAHRTTNDKNMTSNESASAESHRALYAVPIDTQSTSVAPLSSTGGSARKPDVQLSRTEATNSHQTSSIRPPEVVKSSHIFGHKKVAVNSEISSTDHMSSSSKKLTIETQDEKRRASDSLTSSSTRLSHNGRDSFNVSVEEPAVTGLHTNTSGSTTLKSAVVDMVTEISKPSVTSESESIQITEINSTYKPPIEFQDSELPALEVRSTNQLRNLRHSPTKGIIQDKPIEDYSLPIATSRMGSVQRIAILTISACCGLIVICLIVVAMSIKCQSSCKTDEYPTDNGKAATRKRHLVGVHGSRGETNVKMSRTKGSQGMKKVNKGKKFIGARSQSRSNLLLGSELSVDAQGLNSSTESTTSICMSSSSEGINYMNVVRNDYLTNQVGLETIESDPRQRTSNNNNMPINGDIHSSRKKELNSHLDPGHMLQNQQQADMRYLEQHDRSRGATLRQRISGTLTSRLLRLHLPRLLPYLALDHTTAQPSSSSTPYLINNHQQPQHYKSPDVNKGDRARETNKTHTMNMGDLFEVVAQPNEPQSSNKRKDRLERPKSLHILQGTKLGPAQNFHLQPTNSDKLLMQSNPNLRQQENSRKQSSFKNSPAPNVCCHCQNCSGSWLLRESVCLNRVGSNSNQGAHYGVVSRGKLPFGAASSVLRSSPLVNQQNASNETSKRPYNNANCRAQINAGSRQKLASDCLTDNLSVQHSQVDNEHHLLIDNETSSRESQQQQQVATGYSRQPQVDPCYDRMRRPGTTIVYDENEEEAASSITSPFAELPDLAGRHRSQAQCDILGTRFSQRRDMSRESSNNEILSDMRRHGIDEEVEEDDDEEGDSENGNYYNLEHDYKRHTAYHLDDIQRDQQETETRSPVTEIQTGSHYKSAQVSSNYKHHHHQHHSQSRQKVADKSQTNCNCNLVLYPL